MDAARRTVFVVSGDRPARAELNSILSSAGWQARFLPDVATLNSEPACDWNGVVLSDYTLPDGRWTSVLDSARRRLSGAQVVVFSPLADEQMWAEVVCLGGLDVLPQPFDAQEVLRITAAARRGVALRSRHSITG